VHGPSLALTSMVRVARDTNEFNGIDDGPRFTSEAMFAASPQRLNRALDADELRGIVRTPLRWDFYNRLRLRVPVVGAIDASYRILRAPDSQIVRFTEPNTFGPVEVNEAAVGWRRAFDLSPAFDLLLDAGYRRVTRRGVLEWYPDRREDINLFEARPALARFIGPDKLVVGMNFVFMDIPIVPGGLLEDRVRARSIRAFYVDYALYRRCSCRSSRPGPCAAPSPVAGTSSAATSSTTRHTACGWSSGARPTPAAPCVAWAGSTSRCRARSSMPRRRSPREIRRSPGVPPIRRRATRRSAPPCSSSTASSTRRRCPACRARRSWASTWWCPCATTLR
jgi:hypothetical protein